MSRSRKLSIIKDKGDTSYNKKIRRVTKQQVKQLKTDPDKKISDSKELVNDWDITDWVADYEYTLTKYPKETIKNRRK